ncbi:ribosomal RNA-processing protein 14-C-like [Dendronephthya gigantea]|uniref:ribosomal RNA-processing protein 14-C-like n=1 Tax=Dendronephthya gigantea TaxID=151771 RepID=UPI00106AE033|nr:ribosomal RNA-processing protein 14-C-like [Dendronephthya gigantea]
MCFLNFIMADQEDGLDQLKERLLGHSACFNSLLELIPARYYFADNEEEKSNKFYKNKKNKAPKQAVKEATKKAKLSRLDPNQHKTVPEIQAELSVEDGKAAGDERVVSVEDVACSSIGDLRTKLHERIELMKRKRKATSNENGRPAKKAKNSGSKKDSGKEKKRTNQINSKPAINNKKTIVNSEGKVVFSKFDFTSDVVKPEGKGKGNAKKKNYKKLLEKAESRKKKMEEMKEDNSEKAKEMIETTKWKKALGKSEGVKQKDDPALLKKAMKRKEKQKKKHQKDWKERMNTQKKQMKERQDRRQRNIQERIDKKKKKGGRTPGF